MKRILIVAAVTEVLTGLILLVYPPIVIRVLFDFEIAGAGLWISRIAGVSLTALGLACWPDRNTLRAFCAMLTYNFLITMYLIYLGDKYTVGILLWPAVTIHAAISILLVRMWWKEQRLAVSPPV